MWNFIVLLGFRRVYLNIRFQELNINSVSWNLASESNIDDILMRYVKISRDVCSWGYGVPVLCGGRFRLIKKHNEQSLGELPFHQGRARIIFWKSQGRKHQFLILSLSPCQTDAQKNSCTFFGHRRYFISKRLLPLEKCLK